MSVAEAVSITRLEGSRWRFCGGRGGYGESNLTHCIKMGSTFWTKNNPCESQPLNHDAAYATAVKLSEARLLSMPTRSVRRTSGFVVCRACSAVWRWKSSGQPDGGEGL